MSDGLTGQIRRTEESVRDSLTVLTSHWDALLASATPSGVVMGRRSGGRSSRGIPKHDPETDPLGVMVKDDHDETEADMDRQTRVVSLRRFATDVLNGWSRVVMEDRPVTVELPDGSSVPSMAAFLLRHAEWISWHEAGEDCARELNRVARKVSAITAPPPPRQWMPIGECPVTVADADGNSVVCGAKVRAYPDRAFIACPSCGTEDTLAWWMSQIVPEGSDLAHADAVIACVTMRTFRPLSHEQIRKWAHRGFIQRHGKDTKGRTLYSSAAVLAYAQHQTQEDVA